MNQVTERTLELTIGQAMLGGFYAGNINIDGTHYRLIVAPKSQGEFESQEWNGNNKTVEGALSYNDGAANTEAMANAGSKIAKIIRALSIDDFNDFYIPSQDELEIIYRNLKPTKETNAQWARSGINLSSIPPTRPHTETTPTQTPLADFQEGGAEAFQDRAYWTSTQHAAYADYAWGQGFYDGSQSYWLKGNELCVRAVRRVVIE